VLAQWQLSEAKFFHCLFAILPFGAIFWKSNFFLKLLFYFLNSIVSFFLRRFVNCARLIAAARQVHAPFA
jgi:hypothetical protein